MRGGQGADQGTGATQQTLGPVHSPATAMLGTAGTFFWHLWIFYDPLLTGLGEYGLKWVISNKRKRGAGEAFMLVSSTTC